MIYLLQQDNFLKIGYTNNIDRRMTEYHTHNADFELLYVINGNKDVENELHKKFKKYKYNNEWFYKAEDIINYFKENVDCINNIVYNFNKQAYIDIDKIVDIVKLKSPFSTITFFTLCKYSYNNNINLNSSVVSKVLSQIGISKRTLFRCIKLLTENGYLEKIQKGFYKINEKYTINQ